MPHIKTYCRISPCLKKLAWFLITSANISKSGWGRKPTNDGGVITTNYEIGVMFIPKFFGEKYFEIDKTWSSVNNKVFPFIYDLPLTKYTSNDLPWCTY